MAGSFLTQLWAAQQGEGGLAPTVATLVTEVATIFAMHGDGTLSAAGMLTVTKTNGTAFGYFATGTDASHLTGTIAPARLPIATTVSIGGVEVDGTTIVITIGGTISLSSTLVFPGTAAMSVGHAFTPASVAGIVGTTTNDNAVAGSIGEYIFSDVPIGAPIGLMTTINSNMTSIPLTAGDWNVTLQGMFINNAASTSLYTASISLISATLDLTLGRFSQLPLVTTLTTSAVGLVVAEARFSLAAPATIFAVQNATFSAGTIGAFGRLSARRMR